MRLWCFSRPSGHGTLYGIVMGETKDQALDRLRADDPFWSGPGINQIANIMGNDIVFIFSSGKDEVSGE